MARYLGCLNVLERTKHLKWRRGALHNKMSQLRPERTPSGTTRHGTEALLAEGEIGGEGFIELAVVALYMANCRSDLYMSHSMDVEELIDGEG